MATYESDEEQIEALSRWWNENGTKLIIGVVIVLVVLFSARQWQSAQTETAGAASDIYQQMVDVSAAVESLEMTDEMVSSALGYNDALRNDHVDSIYSRFSALLMARVYVEQGDLDKAASELTWILDNPDLGMLNSVDEELLLTARLRLARVQLANGEPELALETLTVAGTGAFVGNYAEVEGDVYTALGRKEEALTAYRLALETTTNAALLELKIEELDE